MPRFCVTSLTALLLSLTHAAQAAPAYGLIDRGAYTTDTTTGLDWLDLTATQGQSIDDAASGIYFAAGWSIATDTQVRALFEHVIATPPRFYNASAFEPAVYLGSLLGVNFSTNTPEGADVIYDPTLPVQWQTAGFFMDYSRQPFAPISYGIGYFAVQFDSPDFPSPHRNSAAWSVEPGTRSASERYQWGGVFMVRDTRELSAPATSGLVAVALVLFAALRHRPYKVSSMRTTRS